MKKPLPADLTEAKMNLMVHYSEWSLLSGHSGLGLRRHGWEQEVFVFDRSWRTGANQSACGDYSQVLAKDVWYLNIKGKSMKYCQRRSGFTLVEILIVAIILGILAAIVIPQFSDAASDAKSSVLTSNLQSLWAQAELYQAHHENLYPWDDGAGGLDSDAEIIRKFTTQTDADGAAGTEYGPYMQAVPVNPYVDNDSPVFAEVAADGVDWLIDVAAGDLSDGRP